MGMKVINSKVLNDVRVGFKSLYDASFAAASVQYDKVAMVVPSQAASEKYGWLGQFPAMRQWLGDRVINGLKEHAFEIANKDFELTVGVDRNAILDDTLGVYKPMMEMMGDSAKRHPDELIFALMAAGFTTLCYDGQNFFDTDHPVLDANGAVQSVSNSMGGSAAAWFILDTNRPIKPLIWQDRQPYNFVALDNPDDQNVFMKKEFIYGVDGRGNAGLGLWQLATASKQTLDVTNYELARAAHTGRKTDYDKPLGLSGNLLVVGPSNEGAAKRLVAAETAANGATNVNKGTAEVLVVPYL
jgi:phage major head subunit gpT-like protein